MLPIVNESVTGDKVSIYNELTHAKHPLNGLRLRNSTALHLMQGPITVFDDNAAFGRSNWRKMKGVAIVELQNGHRRHAEIHWYEAHWIGRKWLKIKQFLD
jgi:hypothetical protein